MVDGVKPTRISLRGSELPDEASITGVYTGDDVDWDSSPGVLGFDQWKQPVRAATTAAITIATALNAGDTLDGVTLAAGDRVLVKDQGTASENGIYVVDASPYRAPDLDEDAEVLGAVVYVIAGTANAATAWKVTNIAATIVDTDAINWGAFGGGGVTVADEGTPLASAGTTLDFVGAGVVATGTGATKTITISGGGSGITVADEGSALSTAGTTLDFVGAGVTASGTGSTKTITIPGPALAPPVVQTVTTFQSSGTTNVGNLPSVPTHTLVAVVCGTSRGATSITQTNVTWTKLYGGNGNSQYGEVWAGTISGTAGTAVTANFASATRSQLEVYEVDHADFTAVGTAITNTSAGSTQLFAGLLTSPAAGDVCVFVATAAAPASSIGGMNVPYASAGIAGGQGMSALFYHPGVHAHVSRQLASSVAWFSAMMKIS